MPERWQGIHPGSPVLLELGSEAAFHPRENHPVREIARDPLVRLDEDPPGDLALKLAMKVEKSARAEALEPRPIGLIDLTARQLRLEDLRLQAVLFDLGQEAGELLIRHQRLVFCLSGSDQDFKESIDVGGAWGDLVDFEGPVFAQETQEPLTVSLDGGRLIFFREETVEPGSELEDIEEGAAIFAVGGNGML